MKRLNIAYVTPYDAKNVHNWSGLGYYIAKAIEKYVGNVDYIGNLKTRRYLKNELKRVISKVIFNKQYISNLTFKVVENYAEEIKNRINGKAYDIIFCPGTVPVALLKTNIPIVFWADACQPGLLDFYAPAERISKESINLGIKIEKLALQNSSLAIYASDWAASIARDYHHIDPAKVKVVPFGANIEHNKSIADIQKFIDIKSKDICRLLFIGVDWKRKGGDIAFNTAVELNNLGLKTELTIVGCEPLINKPFPEFVKSLGFISKSTEEGKNRLSQLFEESHFLIVPSEAEAYGLVFCEANSFGVPAISRKLGGITTIIKDNINGITFNKDAETNEYVNYIYNLMNDFKEYKKLSISSFNEFKTRLNWDTAGQKVKELIEEMLNKKIKIE